MGSIGGKLEDHYFVQKVKLGQGSFGVVWRGASKKNNEQVAVKQVQKSRMQKLGITRESLQLEIKVMMACAHNANVISYHDQFEDSEYISLVLEYCEGGDFGDKLKEKAATLRENEVADWTSQILSAVSALHAKNICHRDIKPDNFMVKGLHPGQLVVADFGLATFVKDGEYLRTKCGTPAFMSPELHHLNSSSLGYRYEVDVWAAGVIMCMLLCGGQHPFVVGNQLDIRALEQGVVNFSRGALSDLMNFVQQQSGSKAQSLCMRLLDKNASTRITAANALADTWLQSCLADGARRLKAKGAEQDRAPRVMSQAQEFARARSDYEDQKEMLEVALKREEALKHMVIEKAQKAPHTLCARGQTVQGRLPSGMKCRYFSERQNAWVDALMDSFNESDGTCNLDIKSRVSVANISPRANVLPSEAWPRGTFVKYNSATSGRFVPAVVISFQAGTYSLDVKDGADVDRICLRLA